MPNLPYQTAAWPLHSKSARRLEFPIRGNTTDFMAPFVYEGPLSTYVPLPYGTVEPEYAALGRQLYLVAQSPLEPVGGGAVRYSRTWAPLLSGTNTYYPGSRYINFPTPTNRYGTGDYLPAYDLEFNQALGQGYYQAGAVWTSVDRRLYQAKAITATTVGRATAGNFTLTYGASTTGNLAYNASAGTIETALNALASATSDGITFAVTNELSTVGRLWIRPVLTSIPSGWPKKITMDATGLTVTTSKNPVTAYQNSTNQFIYLPDHHTISSHGFNTSNRLALVVKSNTLTVLPSGSWGSVDANTIWAPTAGVTGVAYAGDYKRLYQPGSLLVRTRVNETFYLPGVTSGITTPADITVPDCCQDPEVLFPALVGASGWQNYDPEGPAPWFDGGIHRLAITQVNLDDV